MSLVDPALGVPAFEEGPVSPELALVDPALAAVARRRLPERADALSGLASAGTRPTPLALRTTSARPLLHLAPVPTNVSTPGMATLALHRASSLLGRRPRPSTIARFVAAAMVVTVTVTAVLEERSVGPERRVPSAAVEEPIRTGSAAESGVPGSRTPTGAGRPSEPVQPSRQRAERAAEKAPSPRRFAWAPAAGASGYRVELYRRSELVFGASTRRAQIAIPATWKSGGRVHRLEPGEYRWYVWPIVDQRRATSAIVQAKLTVP